MTENTKKLLEIVSGNKELSAKIGGMGKEEIPALTREQGVELTEADFVQKYELSDDELNAVAGGGKCICSFGGGGQYSDGSVRCVCVIGGDGNG